jgi:hypothetical protein
MDSEKALGIGKQILTAAALISGGLLLAASGDGSAGLPHVDLSEAAKQAAGIIFVTAASLGLVSSGIKGKAP